MTRILAVLNQKGGVGKTTTCVNLGAALTRRGYRVLLIDIDPQANLTVHLGGDLRDIRRSTYSLLLGEHDLGAAVRTTNTPGLRYVPSTLALANAEIQLASAVGRELILREQIEGWLEAEGTGEEQPRAHFIIIDCPPSLGILTMNALCAANEVILPIQTEFFALQGVAGILESLKAVQRLNRGLRLSMVVPCMWDRRTTLARDVVEEVEKYFGKLVARTRIRNNVKLAEAPSHGQTIFEYDASSNGAKDYMSLAAEVLGEAATEQSDAAPPPRTASAKRSRSASRSSPSDDDSASGSAGRSAAREEAAPREESDASSDMSSDMSGDMSSDMNGDHISDTAADSSGDNSADSSPSAAVSDSLRAGILSSSSELADVQAPTHETFADETFADKTFADETVSGDCVAATSIASFVDEAAALPSEGASSAPNVASSDALNVAPSVALNVAPSVALNVAPSVALNVAPSDGASGGASDQTSGPRPSWESGYAESFGGESACGASAASAASACAVAEPPVLATDERRDVSADTPQASPDTATADRHESGSPTSLIAPEAESVPAPAPDHNPDSSLSDDIHALFDSIEDPVRAEPAYAGVPPWRWPSS